MESVRVIECQRYTLDHAYVQRIAATLTSIGDVRRVLEVVIAKLLSGDITLTTSTTTPYQVTGVARTTEDYVAVLEHLSHTERDMQEEVRRFLRERRAAWHPKATPQALEAFAGQLRSAGAEIVMSLFLCGAVVTQTARATGDITVYPPGDSSVSFVRVTSPDTLGTLYEARAARDSFTARGQTTQSSVVQTLLDHIRTRDRLLINVMYAWSNDGVPDSAFARVLPCSEMYRYREVVFRHQLTVHGMHNLVTLSTTTRASRADEKDADMLTYADQNAKQAAYEQVREEDDAKAEWERRQKELQDNAPVLGGADGSGMPRRDPPTQYVQFKRLRDNDQVHQIAIPPPHDNYETMSTEFVRRLCMLLGIPADLVGLAAKVAVDQTPALVQTYRTTLQTYRAALAATFSTIATEWFGRQVVASLSSSIEVDEAHDLYGRGVINWEAYTGLVGGYYEIPAHAIEKEPRVSVAAAPAVAPAAESMGEHARKKEDAARADEDDAESAAAAAGKKENVARPRAKAGDSARRRRAIKKP